MSTVLSLQAKPIPSLPHRRAKRSFQNKFEEGVEAEKFFNGKLDKWQGRVEEVEGARLEVLIPHTAFRAMFPNGFVIYYEIEP